MTMHMNRCLEVIGGSEEDACIAIIDVRPCASIHRMGYYDRGYQADNLPFQSSLGTLSDTDQAHHSASDVGQVTTKLNGSVSVKRLHNQIIPMPEMSPTTAISHTIHSPSTRFTAPLAAPPLTLAVAVDATPVPPAAGLVLPVSAGVVESVKPGAVTLVKDAISELRLMKMLFASVLADA